MLLGMMALVPVTRAVDRIVTTTAGTGAGSLTAAIGALADGDTIKFNIAGAGVKYIATPAGGYPFITNNNITFDGYSQPGSSPNTRSIHEANNAQITSGTMTRAVRMRSLSMGAGTGLLCLDLVTGLAEAPLPLGKRSERLFELRAVEIRPQYRREIKFGIRQLPE